MGKMDDLEMIKYACSMATTTTVKQMLWYMYCAVEAGEGSFLNDKMMSSLLKREIPFNVLNNIEA